MAVYTFMVPPACDGVRIDVAIKRYLPELPGSEVQKSFRHKDVKCDGKRVKQDFRVSTGATVQVFVMETASTPPLDIVYENEDVLLVNKPAAISVEPDEVGGVTMTDLCYAHVQKSHVGATPPAACHRLDNQTCGLLLFAKNNKAKAILVELFRDRSMDKRYTCLVRGLMKPPSATCSAFLLKDAKAARVTILDHEAKGAKPIVTAYRSLEAGPISRL